jgi:hypothetical protein
VPKTPLTRVVSGRRQVAKDQLSRHAVRVDAVAGPEGPGTRAQPARSARSHARERAGSVSERYLIGDGCVPRSLGHHHELDPDLALRLIEPESARPG